MPKKEWEKEALEFIDNMSDEQFIEFIDSCGKELDFIDSLDSGTFYQFVSGKFEDIILYDNLFDLYEE